MIQDRKVFLLLGIGSVFLLVPTVLPVLYDAESAVLIMVSVVLGAVLMGYGIYLHNKDTIKK